MRTIDAPRRTLDKLVIEAATYSGQKGLTHAIRRACEEYAAGIQAELDEAIDLMFEGYSTAGTEEYQAWEWKMAFFLKKYTEPA